MRRLHWGKWDNSSKSAFVCLATQIDCLIINEACAPPLTSQRELSLTKSQPKFHLTLTTSTPPETSTEREINAVICNWECGKPFSSVKSVPEEVAAETITLNCQKHTVYTVFDEYYVPQHLHWRVMMSASDTQMYWQQPIVTTQHWMRTGEYCTHSKCWKGPLLVLDNSQLLMQSIKVATLVATDPAVYNLPRRS